MQEPELIIQASALKTLYEEACRIPFPYDGIRELLQEAGGGYTGFIPDLNLYFATIAGYCSWGNRLLKWDDEKVYRTSAALKRGFFDKHPEYKRLESMITQQDIVAKLRAYEEIRRELLHLLERIQKEPTD